MALYHTHPIELFDVPKQKKGYLDMPVVTDVCAFGIYPDLRTLQEAGKGTGKVFFITTLIVIV